MRKISFKLSAFSDVVSVIAVLVIMVVTISAMPIMKANAATFSGGSGTVADPYLIKTADDLNNMRENLSANYKLKATIDMKSFGEFEPIGCLGKPFTGTFTCDVATDGYPAYAIKNLIVYNHAGELYNHVFGQAGSEYYLDYDADGFSNYEASLFGSIKNSTLSNIYVLDASVTNTVVGQQEGVWYSSTRKMCPGHWVQGTAILTTFAYDSKITGCTVTGDIKSTSNFTAGMVGHLVNSTMTQCYSNVKIYSDGYWLQGGFVAKIYDGSTIQYCAADGSLDAKSDMHISGIAGGGSVAGFIGGAETNTFVLDCYSNVELSEKTDRCDFIDASVYFDNWDGTGVQNCYATGKVKGLAAVQNGIPTSISGKTVETGSASNCYILNNAGAKQKFFKGTDAATIKAAFTGLKGWDTSGTLPKLSSLKILTDSAMFVAGKEREGVVVTTTSSTSEGSGNSEIAGESQVKTTSDGTTVDGTAVDGTAVDGTTNTVIDDGAVDTTTSNEKMVILTILAAIVCLLSCSSIVMLVQLANKYKISKVPVINKEGKNEEAVPEDLWSNKKDESKEVKGNENN